MRWFDALLAPVCVCCGQPARVREHGFLCASCEQDWPSPMGACWLGQSFPRQAIWPYAGTVRRLVVQAKEAQAGPQAWLLSQAGSAVIASPGWKSWRQDVQGTTWCLVPPSRKRKWANWYFPHSFAAAWARQCGAPYRSLLRRKKQCTDQAELDGAARRKNLQGVFTFSRAWGLALPSRVLLVDDVSTTGSSLEEARRALLEAGVAEVQALCLAVVP